MAIPLWVGANSTGDGVWSPLGKKRQVMRNSGPCFRTAGILAYCMIA